VAIPEGDLAVLVEVAGDCSRFWNGRGTLLLVTELFVEVDMLPLGPDTLIG
jgi:hypothetical protein